jgi:stringent starvation protein B
MTSSRPYLIRALYQWILDNELTPHLLVDAVHEQVSVPEQYVQDGRIVLNIAPRAVNVLDLGDEHISFEARFGGVSTSVVFPVPAVMAIYARENGQGMMFAHDQSPDPPEPETPAPPKKPGLRVVK